ncbi:cytochrome b/b6 domain-containing protein [Halobacterium sp. KA-4]|uniref:cytochrome b/b6 domain-containing protein n=1 Tax=Halobacterium sp. KA-4 TaxID=2896367 RepID=UPI001E2DD054|nr:cytochrome b/b6 domain-containing protein [Halobacterium sp. KA-4]MCD2199283.1 cytochrome b/b6 domain-containing protein [Halobacterium sp. KA-4]
MTNMDHGKFTRVTTYFHSLLALDVFLLFFTGYSVMFNDELWWMVEFMGGNAGVLALHRIAGFGLIVLTVFWVTLMLIGPGRRKNFKAILMTLTDAKAFVQDVKFVLGRADERHPNARQFAGYSSDEVPLLSYVGKGVIYIFTVELVLLMVSGLLIWSKVGLAQFFQTKAAATAFVTFHGLLGVVMVMGIMFHIYEHGFHPAFYPVEMKAFVPKSMMPHEEHEEHEGTGIELLSLRPTWKWAVNLAGAAVVIGIVSVLVGSIFDSGYPVPAGLTPGGGPTSILLTIGINIGMFVLLLGVVLSTYGNVLRARYEQQVAGDEHDSEPEAAADGGQPRADE